MHNFAAFEYFRRKQCDVVILEVGIGGRHDMTNIVERKKLTIITSIGLDHCEMLGDTTEKITIEKTGIFRENTPAVIGPTVPINVAEEESKIIGNT